MSTDLVSIEQRDAVTLVKLNRGVTNPVNLPLVRQLTEAVGEVREDPSVRGLVLGSANDTALAWPRRAEPC